MAFPNFQGKHNKDAIINPGDFLDYLKEENRLPKFRLPKGVILLYSDSLLSKIKKAEKLEEIKGLIAGKFFLIKGKNIGLVHSGIGASGITTALEELAAMGVKKFINIGTAGSLQLNTNVGDMVVCNRAIRDEGVSHHYIKPSKYAYPSKELTERLINTFKSNGQRYSIGATWTIDAPYRETIEEAKRYQKEGVSTVEMEAAALFAVAQKRKVQVASSFVISDLLGELTWKPKFDGGETKSGMRTLYRIAIETLS